MRLYCQNGNYMLSVTSILNLYKPFNEKSFYEAMWKQGVSPEWVLKESNQLGTLAHNWIENMVNGVDDIFSVDPRNKKEEGLREAVEAFMEEYEILETEVIVSCPEHKFAGRLDQRGRRYGSNKMAILDAKTWGAWNGKLTKAEKSKLDKVRQQLTLYRYALDVDDDLLAVHFKTDGTYTVYELEPDIDILVWLDENMDKISAKIEEYKQIEGVEIISLDTYGDSNARGEMD